MNKIRIFSLFLCLILALCACGRDRSQPQQEVALNVPSFSYSAQGGAQVPADGTIVYQGGNGGGISILPPDDIQIQPTEPATQPAERVVPEALVGCWQAYQGHFMEPGYGAGCGLELYLCENGYGVMELSDGEIFDYNFIGNYPSLRLYGQWGLVGDQFQFSVLEDWLDTTGVNIGAVYQWPYATTQDSFTLECFDDSWTFQPDQDHNNYMQIIRNADGGPTGNDLTGTRTEGTAQIAGLAGDWVMFEQLDGVYTRHLFHFTENGCVSYTRNVMDQVGGTWQTGDICDPYISDGAYYFLNGVFTIAWDCYEVSGLAVTVENDTMTMSTLVGEYFWEERSGTFARCDGIQDPLPN